MGRVIMGFVAGILGLFRMDKSITPQVFLNKGINIDGPNKCYFALVLLYHYYNHPVTITGARIL